MKEQLIEFKTAKLAKEKGFDWYVLSEYMYFEKQLIIHTSSDNFNSLKNRYSAPTQSLLQKWLRDVHNINLSLNPIYGGDKINNQQVGWLCYTPFQDGDPCISLSRNTYEEALEKGLQESLKLIK